MEEDRIETIKIKLNKLRKLDLKYEIFGASAHKYVSHAVSEEELTSFENKYNMKFPEEYRLFLSKIGYSAGPKYGIYSLQEIEKILKGWREYFQKSAEPGHIFEITSEQIIEYKKTNVRKIFYFILKKMDGLLPICSYGCAYEAYIVTTGSERGKLWSAEGDAVLPMDINYLDWFNNWLDDGLNKFS